jgi:streptogramin lyase
LGNSTLSDVILWQDSFTTLSNINYATIGIGGWSLDVTHLYDSSTPKLYGGDGGVVTSKTVEGTLEHLGGNGFQGFSGDNGPALQAKFNIPTAVAVGSDGSLFVSEWGNHRIRKIDPSGIVTTYAGTGQTNCLGDGGPAIQACLDNPVDIRIDSEDALYIADSGHHRIRKITSNGIISTVAGTGQLGFTGDNGPADLATLDNPNALALDDEGNIFISDFGNHVIRKIAKSGKINTIAGNGSSSIGSSNVAALSTGLGSVYGLAVGNDGSLYINAAEGAPIPTIIKLAASGPME